MEDKDQFLRLFLNSEGELLAYILSMGIDPHCAEDVLQETALVMFKKFDEFEKGTNFRAWAFTIVRYQILRLRKWQARQPIQLSDEAMNRLEARALNEDNTHIQFEALTHCVDKLSDNSREMVRMRYNKKMDLPDIAQQLSRPVDSIYTTMSRIRKTLQDCVEDFGRHGAKAHD
ncbi:MAG: hypothetical protein C0404_02390 [Verrucomicrobia bacterium]|nr:hypothetical protein [Verrucomicrobiota bacterium]